MTFETFDQRDEETWPDQQKDNDNDKYNDKHKDNDNLRTPSTNSNNKYKDDLCTLRLQNDLFTD